MDQSSPPTIRGITINTDASFHPLHKVGGYAFYIVSDRFKVQKGGRFKKEPPAPDIAELMAIGNALAYVHSYKGDASVNWIILNTDCKSAIKQISRRTTSIGSELSDLCEKVSRKFGGCKIQFRHVKAHSGVNDARSWVNEWCDTEAKKWMREAVKQLKQHTHEKDSTSKHSRRRN